MPRYFFDVTDAGVVTRDENGIELDDDDEARDQAIAIATAVARERLPAGDEHEFVAVARNQADVVVYEASLALNGRWWPGRR